MSMLHYLRFVHVSVVSEDERRGHGLDSFHLTGLTVLHRLGATKTSVLPTHGTNTIS